MHEYYCNNIYSIWINGLTTTLGALLGAFLTFIVAYYIYRTGVKGDKKKYDIEEKKEALNILNRFQCLIESALEYIKHQNKMYNDFTEQIEKKPTDNHLPNLAISNSLQRLQESESEKLYLAFRIYINEYITENKYTKMFNSIDFLYVFYDQKIKAQERHLDSNLPKKQMALDIIYNISNTLLFYVTAQKNVKDNYFYIAKKYADIFYEKYRRGFIDFDEIMTLTIIPLSEDIKNIRIDFWENINKNIFKCNYILEGVKKNALSHANNYKNIDKIPMNKDAVKLLDEVKQAIRKQTQENEM